MGEQAEDDIEAAKKARKKALEDEERSAEEQTKAARGAAARAAFEAMNKGSLSNENDEDLIANALNPALGKQKQSQIKLLRTKGKELIQAARMKKLQKAFKVALKKAKEKQAAVKQDTKRLVEQAKEGDISSREGDQQEKLEEAVTKAEKLQAALPMLEQLSNEQKTIREV